MNKIKLIIPLIFILLFTACSKETISQSTLNVTSINISDYFPIQADAQLTYNSCTEKGEVWNITNKTTSSIQTKGDSKICFVVEKTATTFKDSSNINWENDITYTINQNSIIQTKSVNIGVTDITNTNPKTILLNKPEWKNKYDNKEDCKITGTNLTIATKAGEFSNCIEVTEEVDLSNEIISTKKYYAPKVGLVLTKLKDKSNFFVVEELVNIKSDTLTSNGSSQSNTSNKELLDNSTTYENKEYNFTIKIPKSWEGKYLVKEGNWAPEAEKTIDFFYIKNNKNYWSIFSIIILKPQYDEKYIKESEWKYIDTKNGKTFAYSMGEDASKELLDGNHENELNERGKMMDEDLPTIIKTLTFN